MLINRLKFSQLFILIAISFLYGCASLGSGSGADKAYEIGEYSKAAALYNKMYSKEKNKYTKGEIAFKMGESYRKINLSSKARSAYSKTVRSNYDNPLAQLYLAKMLLKMGKVEDAKVEFEEYLKEHPSDLLAQEGLKSCEMAMEEPTLSRFEVERVKELRSRYSDFSTAFGGTENDIVFFSSMRHEGKRKGRSRITGQGVSKIYSTRPNSKGKFMEPEALEEPINSDFDDGALCSAEGGKKLYFTRCRYDNTKELSSEICVVERAGGQWGEPKTLSFCADSLMFAHPAVAEDGTVYFVSDLEGGVGGLDIWKIEKGGDGESGWAEPVNMGTLINTPGDEMFPTIQEDGTLYFSSNGHAGFGGLDIFKVVVEKIEEGENEKMRLVHLEKPINSDGDDFGMVYKPGKNEGMFTSSRDNFKGVDNIYKFVYHPVTYSLKGSVIDERLDTPLPNSYVKLVGSDGTFEKVEVLSDATFSYPLEVNVDYVFLVASEGYLNQKVNFSTKGLYDDKDFSYNIKMVSNSLPVVLEDISYDAGKYEITGKIASTLDRLYQMLNDNPTVKIEIASHTDSEGDETDNIVLSQKRAEVIMNYLFKKGIATERIVAKGYGDSSPLTVDRKLADKYNFLNIGDVLTKGFISQLNTKNRDAAIALNRRTEFRVISE